MKKEAIIEIIKIVAPRYGIEPELIMGLVQTESSFNPLAVRYEPHYKWLHNPPMHAVRVKTTIETESTLQRFSWGLCQLMGAVLRERGFMDPLFMSIEPETNIGFGCGHLKSYLDKYKGNIEDAVSAYNQGSNKKTHLGQYHNHEYVKKVMNSFMGFKNFPNS